ncbi:MAG TPA: organic hydroperoxide resistance protein [Phycisphaerales bacterium]|nr:organic hydroperoxide resistance protein [Phycisphaerales bacterium]
MPHELKILHTARATATGGRNGHTQNSDGLISADLSVPKGMGGPGKPNTTTPEDLFAAGYAACFGGAVEFVAKQKKVNVSEVKVDAAVGIGTTPAGQFGLKVDMTVNVKGATQQQAEELVREAHEKVCPYSHATRGNVDVGFTVTAG